MPPKAEDAFRDERDAAWPKGLYRRQGSFRYKRLVEGHKYLEVWGVMSDRDAIDKATQYNLDLRRGVDPARAERARRRTFDEFAYDEWLPQKKTTLRDRTWAKYRSVVDNFSHYLSHHCGLSNCLISDIGYDLANGFAVQRHKAPIFANGSRKHTRPMKTGASKKTLYHDRVILSQLFNAAVRSKLIAENPFRDVKAEMPKLDEIREKHHPLSEAEAASLLVAAAKVGKDAVKPGTARFHDIVFFMLHTGMRENEVQMLEWPDILWDRGVVRVRAKLVTETRTIPIPAGAEPRLAELLRGKEADAPLFRGTDDIRRSGVHLGIRREDDLLLLRAGDVDIAHGVVRFSKAFAWRPKASQGDVPMCKGVHDLLTRLKAEATSNFVFAHHDGGSSRMHWLSLLKEAQRLAKIPGNLRIHDLRHTCAFRLRQRGVPLETIMGILRHADIRETLVYAPYAVEEGMKAIMRLDDEQTPNASADAPASASSAAPTP